MILGTILAVTVGSASQSGTTASTVDVSSPDSGSSQNEAAPTPKPEPNYSSFHEHKYSRAYKLVRRLRKHGDIDEFGARRPRHGWTIQYDLDHGAGVVRTRTREEGSAIDYQIEYEVDPNVALHPHSLFDQLGRESKMLGYND